MNCYSFSALLPAAAIAAYVLHMIIHCVILIRWGMGEVLYSPAVGYSVRNRIRCSGCFFLPCSN